MSRIQALRALEEARVVLLDVDGTLIDSNDAHANAWCDVLRERGTSVSFESVRTRIGMGGDHLLPEVIGILKDSDEGKFLSHRRDEIFRAVYLAKLLPFAGTRELLVTLKARGKKLVVATSAGKTDLTGLLRQAGIEELIDAATTSDDAKNSKPDPDIVSAALRKAGVRPEQAIMLGDTPYDIGAATQANVSIIAFECGGWAPKDLNGAIGVFKGPTDLVTYLRNGGVEAGSVRKNETTASEALGPRGSM